MKIHISSLRLNTSKKIVCRRFMIKLMQFLQDFLMPVLQLNNNLLLIVVMQSQKFSNSNKNKTVKTIICLPQSHKQITPDKPASLDLKQPKLHRIILQQQTREDLVLLRNKCQCLEKHLGLIIIMI